MSSKKTTEHMNGKQPPKRRATCSETKLTRWGDIMSELDQAQKKIKNRNHDKKGEISPLNSSLDVTPKRGKVTIVESSFNVSIKNLSMTRHVDVLFLYQIEAESAKEIFAEKDARAKIVSQ